MIVRLCHRTGGGANDVSVYFPTGQTIGHSSVTEGGRRVIFYICVVLLS